MAMTGFSLMQNIRLVEELFFEPQFKSRIHKFEDAVNFMNDIVVDEQCFVLAHVVRCS